MIIFLVPEWWHRFVGWLEVHETSAQVFVAFVALWVTAALVAITFYYARSARKQAEASVRMAKEARKQAEASSQMVEEMQRQRLILLQPVVAPSPKRVAEDRCSIAATVTNVGNGPAFDVLIFLESVDKHEPADDSQTVQVLKAGDERDFEFRPRFMEDVNIFRFGKYKLIASYDDLYGNHLIAVRSFELEEVSGTEVFVHLRHIEFSGYDFQPGGTAGG